MVAFANKPARIAWAALRREERFAATGNADGGVRARPARAAAAADDCERVTTRWPDSRTTSWKPGLKNGVRRRKFYEDPERAYLHHGRRQRLEAVLVGLAMARTNRKGAIAELSQNPADRALVQLNPEAALQFVAQIDAPPAHHV